MSHPVIHLLTYGYLPLPSLESPNDSGYGSGDCYSSDDEDCYGEGSSEGSGEEQHKYKYREEEEEEEGSGWE